MSNEQRTFEERLRAVGRILDQRPNVLTDLCLLEAGEGFIVQALEAGTGTDHLFRAPITFMIDVDQLNSALFVPKEEPAPESAPAPAKPGSGWLRWRS